MRRRLWDDDDNNNHKNNNDHLFKQINIWEEDEPFSWS